MINPLRRLAIKWFVPVRNRWTEFKEVIGWVRQGKPDPPPHYIKRRAVRRYARRFSLPILVETGTYLGEMVKAMQRRFDEIYSIELDRELYERACREFAANPRVHIKHGDSAKVLHEILSNLSKPALFWLDAHVSGGITARGEKATPVWEELQHILRHPIRDHVVLIDDARGFVGTNDYPTIEEVRQLVALRRPEWVLQVKDDIIRLHLPRRMRK